MIGKPSVMPEQKFSRYELREELGIGGMATVYRAYDPLFEREVALKILRRELLDDSLFRDRFERETKIIARLEHAAIVPVYDVGRDNDQMFFVMRYMAGASLSERIQSGTLSFNEIAHTVQRIAAALDYAHAKNIVHRDLKPGNILFDEYNNAYISDFGIAKISQTPAHLTSSGIIGTPTYMSPEQAQGEAVDGRSDIYSLGVILFEMLSGKTPFEATTPLGMAFKHAIDPVPNILNINPDLPAGIEAVLDKVLAKDPDERYGTGAEFANAFLATLPQPITSDASLMTPHSTRILKSTELTTLPPPATENKLQPALLLWMLGGFTLLLIIAFAVWGYSRLSPTISASTSTPETATAMNIPALPMTLPAPTDAPAETLEPTAIPADPGIGGADKIALTANRDIYLMDVDGSNILQLTNTNIPKFDLQWIPNEEMLLYGEGKCIYGMNVNAPDNQPEEITCFNESSLDGFQLSPDGRQIAISIESRLIVLPFDLQSLSTVRSSFELQKLDNVCIHYADVAVKNAHWSADGQSLAIVYQSVVGQRIGDVIRVLDVDTQRCREVDPLIMDEFPARRFVPDGYEAYPILPSYDWDGDQLFLFNTFKRNAGYGELYLYDMTTTTENKINPIGGVCCYRDATFSPDGTHVLFVFQDIRSGSESETQLYYIPIDQIGTEITFTPIGLPLRFFPDIRENILLAMHPSMP
jgi:serine/threonine protein kinase/Tol biopolymer transport system component